MQALIELGHARALAQEQSRRLAETVGALHREISERRRVEAALLKSEGMFRGIVENLDDVFFRSDLDGTLRFVSPSVARYGYQPDQLVGKQMAELYADPADRNRLSGPLIEQGENLGVIITLRAGDGRRVPMSSNSHVVRDENGRPCGIEGILRDITSQMAAEEVLRKSHSDLEATVDARTAELKRVNVEQARLQAELHRSELLSTLGSLVAGVAHEIRNPLFGISAALDAFEARFGSSPESERYFSIIRGNVIRLRDLMRDLLEYGKPPTESFADVSPADVITAAATACAGLAKEMKVLIEVRAAPGAAPVSMDRQQIGQALENLLQNAIQHSPSGSVVTAAVDQVWDGARTQAVFRISDRGPGFAEADLDHVFEPFFTKRKGGTGLGLSIVRRIVEAHGGEVAAENNPEGGAVVTIKLPILPRASAVRT